MKEQEKGKTKILIADDHSVIRQGLIFILSKTPDLLVIGEAENGQQTLDIIKQSKVDVLLLDVEMPRRGGMEVLLEIKTLQPRLPVLIFSIFPEEHYGIRFLEAGAAGYLNKNNAPENLVEAIRIVSSGGKYISPQLAEKLIHNLKTPHKKSGHEILSNREFQIFCMIANGKSSKQIAGELFLSISTVSTHRARILKKLNFQTNADLTLYAYQNRLISQSK